MLRIYIVGFFILIIAIIANIVVNELGIYTWYSFGAQISAKGFIAFSESGFLNLLWLFVLYPLTLGYGYWLGNQFYLMIKPFLSK